MKKFLILTALLALLLPFSAQAGTTVTLDSTVTTDGGQSVIRWTPGSSIPEGGYRVYISAQNPGGTAELFQFAGTTEGSSLSTGLLAPNRTYNVYVLNAGNQILGSAFYTMEDVPVFEDGRLKNTSVKITKELRRLDHSTDTYTKLNSFSAEEMESSQTEGSEIYYCLKYQMRMPQLGKARSFYVQLVFESPNGYAFTEEATDLTFDRVRDGYQSLWWDAAGANFFRNLYTQTGSIPSGRYTMTLYWDGCYVNTTTFDVR